MKITRNFVLCHYLSGFFLFLAGWFIGLSPIVLFGIPLFFYSAAILCSRKYFREIKWSFVREKLTGLPPLPVCVIILFLILNFLFSLLPPTEHIEADSLLYNLTIPWQYYLRGGVVPLDWSMNDKFPLYLQMAELPFTVLTFPWAVKVWVIFSWPALLVVIWNMAELLSFQREERAWLVAMISALALLGKQFGAANFDIINTVYILSGFYYLVRASGSKKSGDIVWGAIFLGMACATKTFLVSLVLVWLFAFSIWKLFCSRSSFTKRELGLMFFPLLSAVIFMAPFLIRNAFITGNPFFPLFENWLGPVIENRIHHEVIQHAKYGYGYGRGFFDFILMPFRMVWPFPNPIMHFDYWTDPVLLVFLSGAFFSLRRRLSGSWGLLFIVALLVYTVFFMGSQQGRYFYPFWILVALLGGQQVFRWFGPKMRRAILMGQSVIGVTCFLFFHRDALAHLKYLPAGKYLEESSFSHVWNKNLEGLNVRQLCLRQGPGDSIIDIFYFTVPVKILGHTTSLLPLDERFVGDCDRFMIGMQWPHEKIHTLEGKGMLVTKEQFLNATFEK
ncbi:MAG: hypothetical protein Q7T03_08500 [Deltaproteobacteria bacterium]|nr:hypothetical protein [Deltaproteobacteria bacterium]